MSLAWLNAVLGWERQRRLDHAGPVASTTGAERWQGSGNPAVKSASENGCFLAQF